MAVRCKKFALLAVCALALFPAAIHAAEVALPAGKVHEDCFDLAAGQPWEFTFNASAVLDFNVHFHEGRLVSYLAGPKDAARAKGNLIAPKDQHYCLMWTNRGEADVSLQYSYTLDAESPAQAGGAQTPGDSEYWIFTPGTSQTDRRHNRQ